MGRAVSSFIDVAELADLGWGRPIDTTPTGRGSSLCAGVAPGVGLRPGLAPEQLGANIHVPGGTDGRTDARIVWGWMDTHACTAWERMDIQMHAAWGWTHVHTNTPTVSGWTHMHTAWGGMDTHTLPGPTHAHTAWGQMNTHTRSLAMVTQAHAAGAQTYSLETHTAGATCSGYTPASVWEQHGSQSSPWTSPTPFIWPRGQKCEHHWSR